MASKKPVIFGFMAFIFLLGLYFGLMSWLNSFRLAVLQFRELWAFMTILATGFAIQIGLFAYIAEQKKNTLQSNANIAATGGISTASMTACCAHHLTDVAPLIGIGAFTLFLSRYQSAFLLLGIFSNLYGIILMLKHVGACGISPENPILRRLTKINHSFWIKVTLMLGMIILIMDISFIIRGG